MVLRMKNFDKTGALGQFADLRWGLGKKEGSVDTLTHTMASNFKFARDF